MEIKNLHKKKYWDGYYAGEKLIKVKTKAGLFSSYDIYLCDTIIQKNIPHNNDLKKGGEKICEIGSGDGKLVKKLADLLNFAPYGIEYSKEGANQAKKLGVKTIVGDAFDEKIQKKYRNYFDLVFSYGFVEHIMPVEKAIRLHMKYVKPGGYFIVQIPRFKKFNYLRVKFFMPELIPAHNLTIMEEEVLGKLCNMKNVEKIYCSNYGTYKLRLPMLDTRNTKYYLLKVLCSFENILNPVCRILFGDAGFETRLFSPAVMFIGKKIK